MYRGTREMRARCRHGVLTEDEQRVPFSRKSSSRTAIFFRQPAIEGAENFVVRLGILNHVHENPFDPFVLKIGHRLHEELYEEGGRIFCIVGASFASHCAEEVGKPFPPTSFVGKVLDLYGHPVEEDDLRDDVVYVFVTAPIGFRPPQRSFDQLLPEAVDLFAVGADLLVEVEEDADGDDRDDEKDDEEERQGDPCVM